MIPLHLRIAGFLSYQDAVDLDFTAFDLACVSGPNGAGKSTLLDAMTWALFGQARQRDDSLVNLQSRAAEVTFTFAYEGAEYRVQRSLARGKPTVLEFQVRRPASPSDSGTAPSSGPDPDEPVWRPLTERTLRETQARIESALRLDYETFVNASFFLQGKADQFTQQSPGKRKEVLSNILGLQLWEAYKGRAADSRRRLEGDLAALDGRLGEIGAELGEEGPRRQRLGELEAQLANLTAARRMQEVALENLRKTQASIDQQRLLLDSQVASLLESQQQLSTLQDRLADRQAARAVDATLIQSGSAIEAAFRDWRDSVKKLEQWEKVASTFRDRQQGRLPLVEKLGGLRARLEAEQAQLLSQGRQIQEQTSLIGSLESEHKLAQQRLTEADARIAERIRLQAEQSVARENIVARKTENDGLKPEMDKLRTRIETLRTASGAACPLCGQPLSEQHRRATLKSLETEGRQLGDRFRLNRSAVSELEPQVAGMASQLQALASADDERVAHSRLLAQTTERLQLLRAAATDWTAKGSPRLQELTRQIEGNSFAPDLQKQLAKLDAELSRLGYDAVAHDAARQTELAQRTADEDFRRLEAARAALAPLENEIHNLESDISTRTANISRQQAAVDKSRAALEAASVGLPDLATLERSLFASQEQENQLSQQVGAARQKVTVLDDLRLRQAELNSSRDGIAVSIGRHKVLERAFGKDGVPALLIEQALPEIEAKANDVLDRLSNGSMSVRFLTQAGFKNKKREDLRETLDIQISDGAGARDYELYSGGEAFRANFAIRLALSEVLAARKGARLQTLVIDEGFGSQDAQGRQRLIEAINLVKNDFAKILVITHLDELKDAFPTRIEVMKTERGSELTVT